MISKLNAHTDFSMEQVSDKRSQWPTVGALLRLYYLANDKNDMRARIWGCSSEQVLNIKRLSIIQISRMSQKAVIKVATQVIIIMTLQLSVLCV